MSYHQPAPTRRVSQRLSRRAARRFPIVAPMPYDAAPFPVLGQDAPMVQQSAALEQLIKAIAVAVVLMLLVWAIEEYMKRSDKAVARNRGTKKVSTADLAKSLYDRLEKRPGTNPSVLRSLSTYAGQ